MNLLKVASIANTSKTYTNRPCIRGKQCLLSYKKRRENIS